MTALRADIALTLGFASQLHFLLQTEILSRPTCTHQTGPEIGLLICFNQARPRSHTAAVLSGAEKIWQCPSPVPPLSSSSPGSKDVSMSFPRSQLHRKLMPPFMMAYSQHCLRSGAQDLQATQHHLGDKQASHNQSKSFWDIVNVILVATVASIVFLIAALVSIAYIAPPLFEPTTLGKQTSSDGVTIREAPARGTHRLWKPHGRPVSRFTGVSEATLSCLVKITFALLEFTQDIAGLLLFGRLNCQLEEYD
ncbi:hypothetical protein F25303_6847 [Fusarium sp. NRRL 25303]|nr:hypothetical protein F25303_6847 [Fusarium sp. NRRL 25303]